MRSSVPPSQSALNIPPSQNTAPVLEYKCLYTHDLRRKQKRWQDGFLKYHTFNRRVMVYDVPRNFIGDTHCTQGGELQDGDELSLEKGGVLVQVSELVGQTNTDLTELLQKRDKSSAGHGSSSPIRGVTTPRPSNNGPSQYSKHKSLNALLGPSRGPIGKATVASKSPFEQRYESQENQGWSEGRPSKRQKTAEPWGLIRTTTPLHDRSVAYSPVPIAPNSRRKATPSSRALDTPADKAKQQRFKVKEVIDLSSDTLEASELMEDDSSPVQPSRAAQDPSGHDISFSTRLVNSKHFAPQPSLPRPSIDHSGEKTLLKSPTRASLGKTPIVLDKRQPANRITGFVFSRKADIAASHDGELSPPVRTTSRQSNGSASTGPISKSSSDASALSHADSSSAKRGASLRLISTAPRKMLVCQDQLKRRSNVKMADEPSKTLKPQSAKEGPTRRVSSREAAEVGNRSRLEDSPQIRDVEALESLAPHAKRLADRIANAGKKKRRLFRASSESPPSEIPEPLPPSSDAFEPMELPSSRARSQGKASSATDNVDTYAQGSEPARRLSEEAEIDAPKMSMGPPPRRDGNQTRPSSFLHSAARDSAPQAQGMTRNETSGLSEAAPTRKNPPDHFKRAKGPQTKPAALDLRSGGNPVTSTILAKPFKKPAARNDAPKDLDLGPWSREACDLFDWRPPDRDINCKKIDVAAVAAAAPAAPAGLSGGVDRPRMA